MFSHEKCYVIPINWITFYKKIRCVLSRQGYFFDTKIRCATLATKIIKNISTVYIGSAISRCSIYRV